MNKILFIDDDASVLDGLKRMLHDKRKIWDMKFTTSPVYGLELINQSNYDAAVLDIKMPGKSGFEILKEIKTNPNTMDVEVIILTGIEDQRLKRIALKMGATDLLNKPIKKEDLIARLNSVLRIKSYIDILKANNKLLEELLIQSQKMVTIGMLSAGVIHDLNNMLTIITGYSELASLSLEDGSKLHIKCDQIRNAGNRAKKLVQQIHNISKQKGTIYELCDIGTIIDEFIELYRSLIPKGVKVVWEPPKINCQIKANTTQIYQVLMNLCINACQAMKNSGVLKISLTETDLDKNSIPLNDKIHPGTYLRLTVSDSGKGMDKATLQHIFETSFTTKSTQGGTGLGLSVVQSIVKNHGGFISVESTVNHGTTFFVYLPINLNKIDKSKVEIGMSDDK